MFDPLDSSSDSYPIVILVYPELYPEKISWWRSQKGHKIQDILVTSNTALVQHRHTAGCSKVGRVFPMVIWPEIRMYQHTTW